MGILNRLKLIKRAGLVFYLFLVGIILFSGSLYFLAIFDLTYLGVITPIGGVLFILGWSILAFDLWKVEQL